MGDLSMDDAAVSVDERLEPLTGRRYGVEAAALTCRGTDVPGLELVEVCRFTSKDTLDLINAGRSPGALLNGVVLRTFWLGYEFGRASRE